LNFLNDELVEREFVAGDSFSIADITGMIAVDFMKPARIEVPENLTHLREWHGRMRARPSANA